MADVSIGNDESLDSLLKRFNRKVQMDGILTEVRRLEHYEKPSIRRKRKKAAKKRGATKALKLKR